EDGIRDRNVTGVQTCALPILKTKDKKTKSKSDSATHTVVAGDTLSEIAFEYGVTYEELMEWNDLTTTLIYPGQELKVKKVDKKTDRKSTRLNSSHVSISYAVF